VEVVEEVEDYVVVVVVAIVAWEWEEEVDLQAILPSEVVAAA